MKRPPLVRRFRGCFVDNTVNTATKTTQQSGRC